MPLERRGVEAALEAKGFVRVEGDHAFFIYYSQTGKKSPVRTKTSHGTGHKTIADAILSQMSRQCKVSAKQFRNLVLCPLSRSDYEAILVESGLVDP